MEEHAYEFYIKFGKCHGFGVHKGDYGKDDDGNVIKRRFFCNRAGLRDENHYNRLDRKRCHKPETRTNCQAKLSIYLDKESSNWKDQLDGIQSYGLPTSKILGYMARIVGGYSLLGFTKKDAYNYLDRTKRARIADDMSIDDFEAEWAEAVDEYELYDKLWAMQMYEKRKMWANAYLGDKFCAGFRTTSRCEGINSHVKKFLSSKHTILELVQNLELVLREYRNNEMVAQFNSIYNIPIYDNMP
ncbi:hypothetical protein Ahy_A09g043925 [Arachis hypogaea]|uniref:FAR1 domain-containing protein n=1 Tax=Arachis hypogaea TaxID=3818 RepID=A0A445BJ99_ARAHY|nr:hypothetical protein Ahy_A09g043925 [Arachis hypogaea]